MLIYKVTNKINGKCYIGQTIQGLNRRKQQHMYKVNKKSNFYFHNALRKYDENNFEWKVIEECLSKEELNEMEFHYIKQYDSFNNGYNMTTGGDSVLRSKFTEEHKRKISESLRGEKHPMYGKHHTEEHNKRVSEVMEGIPKSEETKRKISKSSFGKKMSKEARRKMSLAKIGKVSNRYGKHHTEKTKKVLAEKSKGNESHAKIWNIIHKGKHIVVKNLQNFCKENGYKYSTIYYRINRGIEI